MAMIRPRRFVNIVADTFTTGIGSMYSLHRLDVSEHLFYPSTAQAHAGAAAAAAGGDVSSQRIETVHDLPSPWFRIQPSATTSIGYMWRTPMFGHISSRSSESRILSIDNAGHTLVADADLVAGGVVLKRMPTLRHDKRFDPILISIAPPDGKGEDLIYVMARTPFHLQLDGHGSSCIDVLRHGDSMALGCQWQALPLPPFVEELWYGTTSERVHIRSHAVVDGGRTICVSFDGGIGTYCFDTVQLAWSKVGDWVLPFKGGAEVVVQDSDVNLLVGFFAENPNHMCLTPEISRKPAMEEEPQPPELRHIWLQGFVAPENWVPLKLDSSTWAAADFA